MKFQHVAVSVSNLQASLAFYQENLGFTYLGRLDYGNAKGLLIDFLDMGDGNILELFSFTKAQTTSSPRIPNDQQRGLRHIGFVVEDVDASYERLKALGVQFLSPPFDARGGVRIVFFTDPDGTVLELVQGRLQFDKTGDIEYPSRDASQGLVFDHVAITVSDLDLFTKFYSEEYGTHVAGDLIFNDDRGFEIRYLVLGDVVLELFGFNETIANPWNPDETELGLKHLGFEVPDVAAAHQPMVSRHNNQIYPVNHALGEVDTSFIADPDGNALEFISGTCTYDS